MQAGRAIEDRSKVFDYLTAATSAMALQSGEQGRSRRRLPASILRCGTCLRAGRSSRRGSRLAAR